MMILSINAYDQIVNILRDLGIKNYIEVFMRKSITR